jgi:hypothetical protein
LSEQCRDSDDEPVEVCGVRLGGLRPGDIDMNKLTAADSTLLKSLTI